MYDAPKNPKLFATSPSLDMAVKAVEQFYAGTKVRLEQSGSEWGVVRSSDNKRLDGVRVVQKGGRFRFEEAPRASAPAASTPKPSPRDAATARTLRQQVRSNPDPIGSTRDGAPSERAAKATLMAEKYNRLASRMGAGGSPDQAAWAARRAEKWGNVAKAVGVAAPGQTGDPAYEQVVRTTKLEAMAAKTKSDAPVKVADAVKHPGTPIPKAPTGWSDKAREASAEARAAEGSTEKWLADRETRIRQSRTAGNKHLDNLSRSVEGMRGVTFHNVHDPKERGIVRTVANTGEVVVDWADEYSAKKNLAETVKDGKKMVARSWLAPTDLKDYAVGPGEAPVKAAPRGMDGLTRAERAGRVAAPKVAAIPTEGLNVERFRAAYEAALTDHVRANPGRYAYGVEQVPDVARRMTNALVKGSADTNSPVIKAVAKAFGVAPKRKDIQGLLLSDNEKLAAEVASLQSGAKRVGDQAIKPAAPPPAPATPLSTFAAGHSPIQSGKIQAALSVKERAADGTIRTRAERIEKAVETGIGVKEYTNWRTGKMERGFAFTRDGMELVIPEKQIGKSGMAYAEHLMKVRAQAAASSKGPSGWSDAAREASAEARGVALPGEAKAKKPGPRAGKKAADMAAINSELRSMFARSPDGKQRNTKGELLPVRPGFEDAAEPSKPKAAKAKVPKEKLRAPGSVRKGDIVVVEADQRTYYVKGPSTVRKSFTPGEVASASKDNKVNRIVGRGPLDRFDKTHVFPRENLTDPKAALQALWEDRHLIESMDDVKARLKPFIKAGVVDTSAKNMGRAELEAIQATAGKRVKLPNGHVLNSTWYKPPSMSTGMGMSADDVKAMDAKYLDWIKKGKPKNFFGVGLTVGAPVALGYLAYEGSKNQAMAAGSDGRAATVNALAAGAAAAGTTAAVGWGISKGIGAAMRGIAAIAPKVAPALGPLGLGIAGAGIAYGAYEGYRQSGTLKGAAFGAVSGGAIPEAMKAPAGQQGRLNTEQQAQFSAADANYRAMRQASAAPGGTQGGWSDQARIAAYIARASKAGATPENLPYGGVPRSGTTSQAAAPEPKPAKKKGA